MSDEEIRQTHGSPNGRSIRSQGLVPMGQDAVDDAAAAGRESLAAWKASQPDNFYSADHSFQRALEHHWGEERYREHAPSLYRFGEIAATIVDPLARESNEPENLPRLNRFAPLGHRIEAVDYHPSYHEAGRHIYASRAMSVYAEPGNNLLALALFYLSSQNGEAGHNCPLACTAGVIKALQQEGSPHLKSRYLPRLLDPNYDSNFTGAQYITEVQGGSDVGANVVRATPLDPESEGTWLINGEKWFCSNVTADLALVTARIRDQGEGTKGLGLFLVPRHLEDGSINGLYIRRLKEKIGTRSLATAEVEFRDALAYQVGTVQHGIHHLMAYVINTSRIYNAFGAAANARRAYVTAWSYAQYRTAFGRPISRFPLVQDLLGRMRTDATAMLAGSLLIAKLLDDAELGRGSDGDEAFLRMAINLNKYRSAILAHQVINQAIEILGGNGAIESFSVLPRLLRDNVVYENWEGTHNVLMAQVQRDVRRYAIHEAFLARIRTLIESLVHEELRQEGLGQLEQIEAELASLLELDELSASVYFRPLMDRLTDLFYTACLAVEGEWEMARSAPKTKSRAKVLMAHFNLVYRVAGRPAKDIAGYTDTIGALCAGL